MSGTPRQVACPIALHPDGAPHRVPIFKHPAAGFQLVKGGIKPEERPEAAAARELYEQSGLETRAALLLGHSDAISAGEVWYFSLCRLAPPVRAEWAHLCKDDGGQLFRFRWHPLEDPLPQEVHPTFKNAFAWIKDTL